MVEVKSGSCVVGQGWQQLLQVLKIALLVVLVAAFEAAVLVDKTTP